MTKTTFDTNPVLLQTLLKTCEDGKLQLPDFQRSWVWEEERIMSLIASVSRGFPMGALMSLKSKINMGVVFACRPIEGVPVANNGVRHDFSGRISETIVSDPADYDCGDSKCSFSSFRSRVSYTLGLL
jgi:hypothetical protein